MLIHHCFLHAVVLVKLQRDWGPCRHTYACNHWGFLDSQDTPLHHFFVSSNHISVSPSHLKAVQCRVSFRNTTLTQNFAIKWHLRPQSNQYYSGNNHSLPQSMFYSVRCCLTGLSMPLELSEMGNLKHPQCITLSLRNTTCDLFICVNHVLYNMTSQGHFGEIKHEHALLCKISTFSH